MQRESISAVLRQNPITNAPIFDQINSTASIWPSYIESSTDFHKHPPKRYFSTFHYRISSFSFPSFFYIRTFKWSSKRKIRFQLVLKNLIRYFFAPKKIPPFEDSSLLYFPYNGSRHSSKGTCSFNKPWSSLIRIRASTALL